MQGQIERLRSGGDARAPLADRQRPEVVKLLVGNVKTLCTKVDTLRDTLPEVLKTAESLSDALSNTEDARTYLINTRSNIRAQASCTMPR
jgi:hypothetical protein